MTYLSKKRCLTKCCAGVHMAAPYMKAGVTMVFNIMLSGTGILEVCLVALLLAWLELHILE